MKYLKHEQSTTRVHCRRLRCPLAATPSPLPFFPRIKSPCQTEVCSQGATLMQEETGRFRLPLQICPSLPADHNPISAANGWVARTAKGRLGGKCGVRTEGKGRLNTPLSHCGIHALHALALLAQDCIQHQGCLAGAGQPRHQLSLASTDGSQNIHRLQSRERINFWPLREKSRFLKNFGLPAGQMRVFTPQISKIPLFLPNFRAGLRATARICQPPSVFARFHA